MSIKKTETLGYLTTKLAKAKQVVENLEKDKAELDRKLFEARSHVKKIDQKIGKLNNGPVQVTDHALVRYFERYLDYDPDILRDHIA